MEQQQNGHIPDELPTKQAWPDGVTIKWKACPHCGAKGSFFEAVTKGEPVVQPAGTTVLFLFPMPYNTLLGPKQITAMMDVCPSCGTMYCRGILKQTVIPQMQGGGERRN